MELKYERRLLAHLAHDDYEPGSLEQVEADMKVEPADKPAFEGEIKRMVREGLLEIDHKGTVRLPKLGDEVVGIYRKNQKGFGFLIPNRPLREGDLFIPRGEGLDALSGDKVRAEVVRQIRRGEQDVVGRIVEVLERKRKSFTGELTKRGAMWLVLPDGKELTQPVVVADATSKNAKAGDKVVVELTKYPEGDLIGEGVIVRVLGEAGLPDVETQAVIAAYDLPGEFPEGCVEQAREATRGFEEEVARGLKEGFGGRIDLRGDFIITIDPPDAKDYDDAISIKKAGDGWELAVHIADVAHFIAPGTGLDEEAKERGNSCYLPRLVIPMLPEILSNGICSLQEGVIRFTKSAFMTYDRDGRIRKEGVGATVIKSAKRLTYLEAQALIDGDLREAVKHAKTEPKYTDELIGTLREMNTLSRAIKERRRKQGMIHLELPEANLIFDDAGHVVDAEPEDDAYTHTLIEMFMVEANEVLARLFEGVNVPLIRRVHPEPTPGDVDELQMYARVAGYKIPKRPTREELQSLLEATAGTGAARAVHMAVLRTLTKAEYSPAMIGHFALASEAYAHFTSPIRRYADTTVHRALTEYLLQTENGKKRPRDDGDKKRIGAKLRESDMCPSFEELVEIGRHISATEKNAEDAEKNLRQFLVLQLLSRHVGEAFEGIVTGVSPSGVFVQLDKYLADGMVKAVDLPGRSGGGGGGGGGGGQFQGGRWQIDSRTGALVQQGGGRSYNIGDRLSVTIANIDLALRKMDLAVADSKAREAGKDKKLTERKGAARDGAGLGGGHLGLDFDMLKEGKTGADKRAARSKSRERGKSDFRGDRKKKGKR
ncbi:MAG: VacB/RNase II family 3'-5' exoribonuclease [Phycisphaerales bacterium]|nr:VacB/RNase II family 3'-5' exoribonuclease [Phycisphaerales bacterium]